MLIIAMNDITLQDNALITNTGPGAVTLVVDEQAPVAPQIGNGRFILYPNAAVTAASESHSMFSQPGLIASWQETSLLDS